MLAASCLCLPAELSSAVSLTGDLNGSCVETLATQQSQDQDSMSRQPTWTCCCAHRRRQRACASGHRRCSRCHPHTGAIRVSVSSRSPHTPADTTDLRSTGGRCAPILHVPGMARPGDVTTHTCLGSSLQTHKSGIYAQTRCMGLASVHAAWL